MINDSFQTPDSYRIVTNSLCLQREFQVVPGSDTQVPGRSCIQRHSLEHRTQSEYIYCQGSLSLPPFSTYQCLTPSLLLTTSLQLSLHIFNFCSVSSWFFFSCLPFLLLVCLHPDRASTARWIFINSNLQFVQQKELNAYLTVYIGHNYKSFKLILVINVSHRFQPSFVLCVNK